MKDECGMMKDEKKKAQRAKSSSPLLSFHLPLTFFIPHAKRSSFIL
jgi:hypothetical protein